MRLPRLRWTLRSLMIGVAGLAVALGGWLEAERLRRWSAHYAEQADENREWAAISRQGVVPHDQWVAHCRWVEQRNGEQTRMFFQSMPPPVVCQIQADYYDRLAAKYERASHWPWLPVAPDPALPHLPWTVPKP